MVKQHSTAKNTQRDSQFYKEKRSERKGEKQELIKKKAILSVYKPLNENKL